MCISLRGLMVSFGSIESKSHGEKEPKDSSLSNSSFRQLVGTSVRKPPTGTHDVYVPKSSWGKTNP